MSEQLKHIFDVSKCPTKRQMQDYLKGLMEPEETYAFEHHINSCLCCGEALDGMMEHKEEALAGMASLNNNFLKDHLELHPPHIHLNGIATAAVATGEAKHKRNNTSYFWKPVGIAAALLLCVATGWYFKNSWRTEAPIARQQSIADQSMPANSSFEAKDQEENANVQKNSLAGNENSIPPEDDRNAAPRMVLIPDVQEKKESAAAAQPATAEKLAAGNSSNQPVPENVPETSENKSNSAAVLSATEKKTPPVNAFLATQEAREERAADAVEDKKAAEEPATERTADELYKDEEYSKALTAYKKLIRSDDPGTSQYAKLMAARCYLNLGQKQQAQKLLSELVDNGSGSEKREARRLLKGLDNEAEK